MTEQELPVPATGRTPWTTRRWLGTGVCVAVIVLAGLSAVAAATFQHAGRTTDRLTGQTAPALVASVQLEAALVNQETGVRGYGLTGQSDFLQPYTQALAQQNQATATLTALTAGDSRERADLEAVLARSRTWQQRIAVPIAASPPGAPPAIAAERAQEGKALFDDLRTAMTAQQADLQQGFAAGRADIAHVRTERNQVFAAIGGTLLVLSLLVFAGLRRGITRPLGAISGDARRVSAGEFTHPITQTGPGDLRALAADVERMRLRLNAELDVSDRIRRSLDEQADDLRRSNQELEQFAYVASHDLQEPLRKIASFCQLLQRRYGDQLDERADQYIGFAVDGAERMQKLINDLLAFSRVGRIHQGKELVSLESCLAAALSSLELAVEESGAEITHERLPEVSGDTTQLTLLLQNLLSNAIKFRRPEQTPRVALTAQRTDGHWELAVTDNGIGVATDFTERVFLIFQRLHTKDAYPGSGIGLAMCRKIVEFHGGDIRIDPEHRDGTRIVFTLPVAEQSAEHGSSDR